MPFRDTQDRALFTLRSIRPTLLRREWLAGIGMVLRNTDLAERTALTERIRQEVVRWANPILGSVMELEKRLENILEGWISRPVAERERQD
jgi:hypothetical protein